MDVPAVLVREQLLDRRRALMLMLQIGRGATRLGELAEVLIGRFRVADPAKRLRRVTPIVPPQHRRAARVLARVLRQVKLHAVDGDAELFGGIERCHDRPCAESVEAHAQRAGHARGRGSAQQQHRHT